MVDILNGPVLETTVQVFVDYLSLLGNGVLHWLLAGDWGVLLRLLLVLLADLFAYLDFAAFAQVRLHVEVGEATVVCIWAQIMH
jgi:hypothetical protein